MNTELCVLIVTVMAIIMATMLCIFFCSILLIIVMWFKDSIRGIMDHLIFEKMKWDYESFNKLQNLVLYKIEPEELRKEIVDCFRGKIK